WYLYVRFPKTTMMYPWPVLIYSDDIPRISKLIESIIFSSKHLFYDRPDINGFKLYEMVQAAENFTTQAITLNLQLPDFGVPYYEGFNKYGNKTWLGIYRRDELFDVSFLKDICNICLQTKIG